MVRSARESATTAWFVAMLLVVVMLVMVVVVVVVAVEMVVVVVRVCVVVLLGVLSMRRAAVIGKSIPDGTNQLAPRSSVIRTRRLTVRSLSRRSPSSPDDFFTQQREKNETIVKIFRDPCENFETVIGFFLTCGKKGFICLRIVESSSFKPDSDIGRARFELSI